MTDIPPIAPAPPIAPIPPMVPAKLPRPDKWDILRFVLFFLLILVLGIVIIAALAAVIWGETGQQLRHLGMPQTPQDFWLLLAVQIVVYVSVIGGVWLAVTRRGRSPALTLAFRPVKWWIVLLGAVATVALSFVADILLQSLAHDTQSQMTEAIQGMTMTPALAAVSVAMIAVLAPIGEEMLFRGLLFGWLRAHWPFWLTALVTSALFGLAHGNLEYAVVAGILGLLLAYLRERTGSLWASIGAHILNNAFAVLLIMLTSQV